MGSASSHPGGWPVVIALSKRSVVIPLLIALAAVMAMTLLPRSENSREEPSDGAEPDASEVGT